MGNASLDPETALWLFHILFYCMAYLFGGAAVIGLSVYIVLVCSEMFFSQPRSKTQHAKAPQSTCRVPVAEESLELPVVETRILAAPNHLGEEVVRVTAPVHGGQVPMTVPATLESEPTWS